MKVCLEKKDVEFKDGKLVILRETGVKPGDILVFPEIEIKIYTT